VFAEKRLIAGRQAVLDDRVGNVGGDMMLLDTGQDRQPVATRPADEGWGGFLAGVARLPGIECAAIAHRVGLVARALTRMVAIHQQRAGRRWLGEEVERPYEGFVVPEDVAAV